jgi:hypothetical protein
VLQYSTVMCCSFQSLHTQIYRIALDTSACTYFYVTKTFLFEAGSLFNVALGDNSYLRPYTTYFLLDRGVLKETTLARIVPESLLEAEVHLSLGYRDVRRLLGGISGSSLQNLRDQGMIKFKKVNKIYLYDPISVEKLLTP